jgi:hypothetical protein
VDDLISEQWFTTPEKLSAQWWEHTLHFTREKHHA